MPYMAPEEENVPKNMLKLCEFKPKFTTLWNVPWKMFIVRGAASNLYARQQQYRRNTNIPSFFFFFNRTSIRVYFVRPKRRINILVPMRGPHFTFGDPKRTQTAHKCHANPHPFYINFHNAFYAPWFMYIGIAARFSHFPARLAT